MAVRSRAAMMPGMGVSAESVVVVHYGEVALKGQNRSRFEARLADNIRWVVSTLPGGEAAQVVRPRGRLLVSLPPGVEWEPLAERLARVFGMTSFSRAVRVAPDLEAVSAVAVALAVERSFGSFAIRPRRADKSFAANRMEIGRVVGDAVQRASGARVDLETPELEVHVEILPREALVYVDRRAGPGGLPVGVSGRVAVMLSGGIDSPVAAWMMMKRGCPAQYIHFHSAPFTDQASQTKVETLAGLLARHQGRSRLVMVPFAPVQEAIVAGAPARLRILLYRRYMVRIAAALAQRDGSLALVTGESLGQVASQTLENLAAIQAACPLPILRPLVGLDKQEIVDRARQIGTFDLSIQPHQDCCSFLMPDAVATRATARQLDDAESALDTEALVSDTLERCEDRTVSPVGYGDA